MEFEFRFEVIDNNTSKEANLYDISNEPWVHDHLMYTDIEGRSITQDQLLILLDECGNYVYAPVDRFIINFSSISPYAGSYVIGIE